VSWAEEALEVHQRVIAMADNGDAQGADRLLHEFGDMPIDSDGSVVTQYINTDRPEVEPAPGRRRRSDAGKPRARKPADPEDGGGSSANPADVRAADARRTKLAGEIRRLLSTHSGAINDAVTVDWIGAQLDTLSSSDEIRAALKLLSVVSWQMRRDGDSNPVEVWGTHKQLGEYLFETFSHVDSDVLASETGIDVATIRMAIHAAEDR
jgi:hypothetical protein